MLKNFTYKWPFEVFLLLLSCVWDITETSNDKLIIIFNRYQYTVDNTNIEQMVEERIQIKIYAGLKKHVMFVPRKLKEIKLKSECTQQTYKKANIDSI